MELLCSLVAEQESCAGRGVLSVKIFHQWLAVRLANTGVELMSLYGTLKRGSKWAPLQGKFGNMCQINLGLTIGGGTTEIQGYIIARMGLQLPTMK